jgi:hypothetical protein
MTNEPTETEGLTDEEITPDLEPETQADPGQASDPDIRNTAPDHPDTDDSAAAGPKGHG